MLVESAPDPLTINELLTWAKARLSGIAQQELEASILLTYVLGKNTAELIVHGDRIVSIRQIARYKKIVCKRQQGVPIAYLIASREFWSLPIMVNEQVLIPRHETETLVELVLALLGRTGATNTNPNISPHISILELGTGSGAIALALASALPYADITATDNSVAALALARTNQMALGLHQIEFLNSDWFEKLAGKKYRLICANPPYLSADDAHLQHGDLRFEPREALVADEDDAHGYAAIRHIVSHAKPYIHLGGWLVLEHGFEQGSGVRQLLSGHGYCDITTHQDLSGNDRVTAARTSKCNN